MGVPTCLYKGLVLKVEDLFFDPWFRTKVEGPLTIATPLLKSIRGEGKNLVKVFVVNLPDILPRFRHIIAGYAIGLSDGEDIVCYATDLPGITSCFSTSNAY